MTLTFSVSEYLLSSLMTAFSVTFSGEAVTYSDESYESPDRPLVSN